jgi:hypothetical protein
LALGGGKSNYGPSVFTGLPDDGLPATLQHAQTMTPSNMPAMKLLIMADPPLHPLARSEGPASRFRTLTGDA